MPVHAVASTGTAGKVYLSSNEGQELLSLAQPGTWVCSDEVEKPDEYHCTCLSHSRYVCLQWVCCMLQSEINALAFTGGSRYLATAGVDLMVHVWDLKKRECIRHLAVR